jgi:glutaredoxin
MAVKIYTTETCPECKVVKSYLSAMNVLFEEVVVNTPELIDEVVNLTGQRRIPVIRTDSNVIVGFDRERIKTLIS